jgi:hypothetical protein
LEGEAEAEVETYITQRMEYFAREINRYSRWQTQA